MRVEKSLLIIAAGALGGLAAATAAGAVTLTFDGAACVDGNCNTNSELISQSYGDVAGQLDVQYDRVIENLVPLERLSWWSTQYSDLIGVAWGGNSDTSGTAEVFLDVLPGYQVTLLGLDLGSWPNTTRGSQVTILSEGGTTLASSGPVTVNGQAHSHFGYSITRADGIRIQWGPSAFNVGIDNIEYTVSPIVTTVPIPEPGTWALMIGGFGLAGAALRRRRQVAA